MKSRSTKVLCVAATSILAALAATTAFILVTAIPEWIDMLRYGFEAVETSPGTMLVQ